MPDTPMRIRRRCILALLLAVASATVVAQPPRGREERVPDKRAMRDVISEVERTYHGHVVDIQPPSSDDDMYRVRVLQEGGRVKTVRVPARSGR